jgi:hypothetical protein
VYGKNVLDEIFGGMMDEHLDATGLVHSSASLEPTTQSSD